MARWKRKSGSWLKKGMRGIKLCAPRTDAGGGDAHARQPEGGAPGAPAAWARGGGEAERIAYAATTAAVPTVSGRATVRVHGTLTGAPSLYRSKASKPAALARLVYPSPPPRGPLARAEPDAASDAEARRRHEREPGA